MSRIPSNTLLSQMAKALRVLSMDAVEKAQSGHPGMPMGMADVVTVLFSKFFKFDPQSPSWPDRDRFVLSAGHGSILLYSLLYLTGYEDMSLEELKNFRQWKSLTPGHPEYGKVAGIETTTGPLGQGLGNAVGMALAEKIMAAEFGTELVDHKIYAVVGDGCLMEGISHEVMSFAGHFKLDNLIVLFDDNHISIDGETDLAVSDDTQERVKAYNWDYIKVDGHNYADIEKALERAQKATRPVLIACRTQIGKGAPHKGGTASVHGAPLGAEEVAETRKVLDWPFPPFVIPEEILSAWRQLGVKGQVLREAWEKRLHLSPQKKTFERRLQKQLLENWQDALTPLLKDIVSSKIEIASRQLSQRVLNVLFPLIPELIGGSADLTGSNNTYAQGMQPLAPASYRGSYIHYGVREHGMAAIMNGLALHGEFIPYGGTFLVFSDYCRPSIRLAALMGLQIIYVMTHDSIGLGEDGPTHQPVEHLASFRAMPNLLVFRPADAVEVVECWKLALLSKKTPSILALTRQKLPLLRENILENLSSQGAYILKESKGVREVTLLSSGSEVSIALKAQKLLETKNIPTAVVSMPCWELFDQQSDAYRERVLGVGTVRVAIEAASSLGWEKYVGSQGVIMGLDRFGDSAPYEDLYREFGLTSEEVVKVVESQYRKFKLV